MKNRCGRRNMLQKLKMKYGKLCMEALGKSLWHLYFETNVPYAACQFIVCQLLKNISVPHVVSASVAVAGLCISFRIRNFDADQLSQTDGYECSLMRSCSTSGRVNTRNLIVCGTENRHVPLKLWRATPKVNGGCSYMLQDVLVFFFDEETFPESVWRLGYGLHGRKVWVRFRAGERDFSP